MPVQIIDKLLGIDKIKKELKAYQAQSTISLYNQVFPTWQSYKAIYVYHIRDIIYSVVNKLAKTAAAIPQYAYNAEGEDLPATDKLSIFLKSLTYIKRIELYTWLYLVDEAFCYKEKSLGVNGFVEKMVFLNPAWCSVVVNDTFPQEIVFYVYQDPNTGFTKRLELDEVIFIHGFNPSNDPNLKWRGLPKPDVLCQRLNRMQGNMNNSVAQMQNGGVPGVLFVKDLPHTAQSKSIIDGIKTNWAKYSTNPANKGAPFVQPGEMGWLPMGLSMVDMDSIELEKVDDKAVCNVWGISNVLLNSDSSSTESNVLQMIRQMYSNAVMPYTKMVDDAFNTELVTDFGGGYKTVKSDYSDVQELQSTLKESVDALAAAPVMIPNDVLEALGYDRDVNPLMDMPLVKTGYEPIDNFEALPPIE